jgi:hypothetical protein
MRRPIRETRVRPSNILRWMRKQDTARYGNGGLPPEEAAIKKAADRAEIEEHKIFLNWCKLTGIPRVYSRPDRRPTIAEGWPDFSVFYGGLTIFFDFKVKTKPSRDQEITIGCLREVGFEVFEIDNAAAAISIASEVFGL